MKKLMIAAAAMASITAFADCDIPTTPVSNCAEVYDVVLNLKTTECRCRLLTTRTRGSECGIPTSSSTTACVAWRQIVTKKVQGVVFSCYCDCTEDVGGGSVLDGNSFAPAIWNMSTGDDMSGNQFFWIAKDRWILPETDLMTIKWLARIGQTKNQVEAAGTFGDGIYVAGYGSYNVNNRRVQSISGYAAGVWGAPLDCSDDAGEERCPAYQLCDETASMADYSKTFAAGTWSVKYNAAKSVALARNRNALWGRVVPNAVAGYDLITWYESVTL